MSMTLPRAAVRAVVFAIVTSFSGSVWAACADAAFSESAAMACCKDGEMACTPHGSAQDCCQIDAARPHALVAGAKLEPVHALIAVVVVWGGLPDIGTATDAHARFDQPTSPPHIDPGPPPYIAFSSLLI